MLKGAGHSLTWNKKGFLGFLFFGFLVVGFLISRIIGFLVSEFLGFLVSKIQNPLMCLKDILSIIPKSHFMFLIDIDPISKIFKNIDGFAGFFGARLF